MTVLYRGSFAWMEQEAEREHQEPRVNSNTSSPILSNPHPVMRPYSLRAPQPPSQTEPLANDQMLKLVRKLSHSNENKCSVSSLEIPLAF